MPDQKQPVVHAALNLLPDQGHPVFAVCLPACGAPHAPLDRLTQHLRNVTCPACLGLLTKGSPDA